VKEVEVFIEEYMMDTDEDEDSPKVSLASIIYIKQICEVDKSKDLF